MTVTMTDDRGDTWSASPFKTKNRYVYELCINDPLWHGDANFSDFPPIPGTNGGVGYVTHYTLSVTAAKTGTVLIGFDMASNRSEGQLGYKRQLKDVPCPPIN